VAVVCKDYPVALTRGWCRVPKAVEGISVPDEPGYWQRPRVLSFPALFQTATDVGVAVAVRRAFQ
jgi:hypothetical protein